jgi:DNA-binding SARP family transcriptional activator
VAALSTSGDHVTLDVETDVQRVEILAAGQDPGGWQEALALWRGMFLDGMAVREPGFDDWADQERRRLAGLRADLLARLTAWFLADGDGEAAIERAASLVALEPLREDGHRLLISALATTGRRAEALAQYDRLTALLRTELGVSPDPVTRALADELRSAARKAPPGSAPTEAKHQTKAEAPKSLSAEPMRPPAQKARFRAWRFVAAFAGAAAVLSGAYAAWRLPKSTQTGPPTLIVQPFEALTPDAETAQLARILATRLSTGLGGLPIIRLRSADDRQADLRVEGTVTAVEGGQTLVTARLVRQTGEVLQQTEFKAVKRPPIEMQDEILGHVGHRMTSRLNDLTYGRRAVTPDQIRAQEMIETANNQLRRGETGTDIVSLFEEALRLDPENVNNIATYGQALTTIAINSTADDAVRLQSLNDAIRVLTAASERAPHHIALLSGRCGALRGLAAHAAARAICERARSVSPWNAHIYREIGYVFLQVGALADAEGYFKASERLWPQHSARWTWALGAGFAALLKDEPAMASDWFDVALSLRPNSTWYPLLAAVAAQRQGHEEAVQKHMQRFYRWKRGASLDQYLNTFFPPAVVRGPDAQHRIDRLRADMTALMQRL